MNHRHDVWGDDPEERDASAVVEQIESASHDVARRWHHHPAFVPIKATGLFIGRNGKRVAVTVVGFAVILAGIAMLVLPGPGWAAIFLGLAILSTEYVWAQRLLRKARDRFGQAQDAVLRRRRKEDEPTDDPPSSS